MPPESLEPDSPTAFGRQLALGRDPERDGHFLATLDEAWNCPYVPHGGLITAISARAMAAALDAPDLGLRSVTATFAAPVVPGPAEIEVTTIRRGRGSANLRASLVSAGHDAGLVALAFFGAGRAGPAFVDRRPPTVPPPEHCPRARDSGRRLGNFWYRVDQRMAIGHGRDEIYEPITSECAFWYRFDEPPMRADGTLDPMALVTLCDVMPMAVYERAGPGPRDWEVVSLDLTVHVLGSARSEWILGVNRARRAGDGYVSVENELWDPVDGLVAYGTEMQIIRTVTATS